jgi:hypothetical protein
MIFRRVYLESIMDDHRSLLCDRESLTSEDKNLSGNRESLTGDS